MESFSCPSHMAGAVIGHHGSAIAQLRRETHCHIEIEAPRSGSVRNVSVYGPKAAVEETLSRIRNLIFERSSVLSDGSWLAGRRVSEDDRQRTSNTLDLFEARGVLKRVWLDERCMETLMDLPFDAAAHVLNEAERVDLWQTKNVSAFLMSLVKTRQQSTLDERRGEDGKGEGRASVKGQRLAGECRQYSRGQQSRGPGGDPPYAYRNEGGQFSLGSYQQGSSGQQGSYGPPQSIPAPAPWLSQAVPRYSVSNAGYPTARDPDYGSRQGGQTSFLSGEYHQQQQQQATYPASYGFQSVGMSMDLVTPVGGWPASPGTAHAVAMVPSSPTGVGNQGVYPGWPQAQRHQNLGLAQAGRGYIDLGYSHDIDVSGGAFPLPPQRPPSRYSGTGDRIPDCDAP